MGFFYNHLGHKIISACLGKKAFTNNPYLGFVIEAEECDVIPDELYRLSVAYRKGEFMLPQNNKKSREFCLKAAKKGHACAQLDAMRWVMNYENDHNDEVIFWLKSAAAKGEPQALYNMAISFHRGDVGGGPDLKESNRLLRLSAEYGYPSAFARMAQVYSVGDGIEQNINIAKYWAYLYYNACKSNGVSDNGLLDSLLTAENLNEDNQIDCDKIIQDAALEGETDAINNIANTLYKTGRVDDAVKYWEEASQKKHPEAMVNLARRRISEKDFTSAKNLLNDSVLLGCSSAECLMAYMLTENSENPNYAEGWKWLEKSLNKSHTPSKYLLASWCLHNKLQEVLPDKILRGMSYLEQAVGDNYGPAIELMQMIGEDKSLQQSYAKYMKVSQ